MLRRLVRETLPEPIRALTRPPRAFVDRHLWTPMVRSWRSWNRPSWHGRLDSDGELQQTASFSGWIFDRQDDVVRVEIEIDGRSIGRARYGLPRSEAARFFAEPAAAVAGFRLTADLPAWVGDSAGGSVVAVGWTRAGKRRELGPWRAALAPSPAPIVTGVPAPAAPARRPMPRPPLRLLAFTHSLTLGGAQTFLDVLLRGLTERGGVAASVVTAQDGPLREPLERIGAEVRVASVPAGSAAGYEEALAPLLRWAEARRFDAALINTMGAFAGADLARRLALPSVWALHESFELPVYWKIGFPNGVAEAPRACALAALRDATAVFSCQATQRLFAPYLDPARSAIVVPGVEPFWNQPMPEDRATLRRRLGLPDTGRVLVSTATIEPRKGQIRLVQAFARAARRHPGAVLALVGDTDTPYSRALRELVQGCGLAGRVVVAPLTLSVKQWLAAADLFVLGSDVESSPRALVEAMACGLPVVATSVFGVPELVSEREGLLCEPNDLGSLEDALTRALELSREELAALGGCAARRAREQHRSEDFVGAYERILFRAAGARAGRDG